MEYSIRKAGIEDTPFIAPLFDAYRCFYQQASDINAAYKFIHERLVNNESIIFLAVAADVAVGFIQLYPIFTSVGMCRTWLLNDLYVHHDARKNGIASVLLDTAKTFAAEHKSKWLMLQTSHDNFPAQSLYEKNGWIKEKDFFYRFDV